MVLFAKSISDPLNLLAIAARQQYRVKPAWRLRLQRSKIMPRRTQQLPLFHPRYAGCCAAKGRARSHSYLHEYQGRPVTHDEIDFTRSTAIVSLKQNKVMMTKKGFRVTFRLAAIQNKNSVGAVIQITAPTINVSKLLILQCCLHKPNTRNCIEPDPDTTRHPICYRHTNRKPARHHAAGT